MRFSYRDEYEFPSLMCSPGLGPSHILLQMCAGCVIKCCWWSLMWFGFVQLMPSTQVHFLHSSGHCNSHTTSPNRKKGCRYRSRERILMFPGDTVLWLKVVKAEIYSNSGFCLYLIYCDGFVCFSWQVTNKQNTKAMLITDIWHTALRYWNKEKRNQFNPLYCPL